MRRRGSWRAALLAVLGWAAVCGCSGGGVTRVTGTVTLDGKPLGDAQVAIEGKSDRKLGAASTRTDANGRFQLDADARSGRQLKPGTYRVFISKYVDKRGGKVPDDDDPGQLEASGAAQNLVPALYSDREHAPTVELKAGQNDLPPIALTGR
jgi:hypothetical protein